MTHCPKCDRQGACREWINAASDDVALEIIWMDVPSIARHIRARVRRGEYDSDTDISRIVDDLKNETQVELIK